MAIFVEARLEKFLFYDNMFFREGEMFFHKCSIFDFNVDEFITACENSIKKVEQDRINHAGLRLQNKYPKEEFINKIINITLKVIMFPNIHIRLYSSDQYSIDKEFYSNIFGLKGYKDKKPTVLDIGAGIGAFAICAHSAGCKVTCIEPFLDNYRLLCENVGDFCDVHQFAIYRENGHITFASPKLEKSYIDYSNILPDNKGKYTAPHALI